MVQLSEENAYAPVRGYVAKRSVTVTKTDATILETPQSIGVVPASVMYGQSIPGGMVNSISKRAQEKQAAEAVVAEREEPVRSRNRI